MVKSRVIEKQLLKKYSTITLIPGAGNHSEKNEQKIFPSLKSYLDKNKFVYRIINKAVIEVDTLQEQN